MWCCLARVIRVMAAQSAAPFRDAAVCSHKQDETNLQQHRSWVSHGGWRSARTRGKRWSSSSRWEDCWGSKHTWCGSRGHLKRIQFFYCILNKKTNTICDVSNVCRHLSNIKSYPSFVSLYVLLHKSWDTNHIVGSGTKAVRVNNEAPQWLTWLKLHQVNQRSYSHYNQQQKLSSEPEGLGVRMRRAKAAS